MKKGNLIVGILYLLAGFVFLGCALFTDTKLDGVFFGLAGAGIVCGGMMMYQYCYWNSTKNKKRYMEKLEQEQIEKKDELKEKIRGKSGQYAYAAGLFVTSFSALGFAIIDSLEVLENANIFALYLVGFLVFQIGFGLISFQHIMKKYES